MEVARNEAGAALDEVREVTRTVRGRAAYAVVGPILILWGVVWITCFLVTHFAPGVAGWAWLVGDTVGIAGTLWFGWLGPGGSAVRGEGSRSLSRRLFWFWLALFLYADVWLALLWPWRGDQLGTFGVTLIMFAYVVMGLWLGAWFLLVLGIAVTVLAGAGYVLNLLVVPGYLNLWLACTGGAALLGAGAYLVWRWRARHARD